MSTNYGIACPAGHSWCEHDKNSPADEHTEIGAYTPATAAASKGEVYVDGVTLPTVAAMMRTDHGNPVPYVVLHLSGPDTDAEVHLQFHEAEKLAAQLAERAAIARTLIGGGAA